MVILTPNAKIARHWTGALQARLRRDPLESFLRHRGLLYAPPGPAQDADNLTHATLYILNTGVQRYTSELGHVLSTRQQTLVGYKACQISYGLATLIGEPNSWRIPALVTTTKQLSPYGNLLAAAQVAAAAAHCFAKNAAHAGAGDIRGLAASAVERNDNDRIGEIARIISRDLAAVLDRSMIVV